MKSVCLVDSTLREGHHILKGRLTLERVADYCAMADAASIPIVEVGHHSGLGASSLQRGELPYPELDVIRTARRSLRHAKLSVLAIPGFATLDRNLAPALDEGVDIVRIAVHAGEADLTERHLDFVRKQGKTAYGSLLLSHRITSERLFAEAKKMEDFGAEAVFLVDSAGHYLPGQVYARMRTLTSKLRIPLGFSARNDLSLALTNSVAAVESGAMFLEGTARGLGPGAGSAQLEALVAVLTRMGYRTNAELEATLNLCARSTELFSASRRSLESIYITKGLLGMHAGRTGPAERLVVEYRVNPRVLLVELGKRGFAALKEDGRFNTNTLAPSTSTAAA